MDEFEAVTEGVAARVVPDDAERERLARTAARVVADAEAAAADLPVEADVVQVGSTARGTWVSGDRDIDVFVRFPPDLPRRELERYGLEVGRAVLPDGHEEYAEHPYVKGTRGGFEVDLVPCYAVEDATAIQSAVDRTPFHTAYLAERLDDDSAEEVVLTKAFLKGVGVYGSDLRTRGFSGYLTELLVLECGGFRAFLEAVRRWHPPVELDPEGHAAREFDDPLVVVDPTDPERNVAAVLSAGNVARLVHHARAFLDEPRVEAFEPRDPDPLDADAMAAHLERRGTTPFAVRFPAPDLVDDQLYPQLEKSLSGVVGELDRRGFDVLRAATFADGTAVLFVECEVAERPRIARHEGPPVWVDRHATGFYGKYADGDAYGPFVDGERYVVERERGRATAREWLESDDLLDVSLGVAVAEALRDGYEVLEGEETTALAAEFGVELARYFDPRP
ncbi:CCA tRNA nucleotidyltransferase [Halomarina halobia]|uniref:CCA-adding enzyme n=1 Tax=Halomarina halobia TaxID=3033386 RepID=A0ABD6AA52_9EURY|nr:CCA tRNA nucleotidyltransferase [Halomarina sp. PSR21]